MTVELEGCTFDERTAAMVMETRFRLSLLGIPFQWSQGSYSGWGPSGGTHTGGGAVDAKLEGLSDEDARTIETLMREVGFAAWYRPEIRGLWPRHVHGIAIGCPDMSPQARQQVTDYRNRLDGLAARGPDTGDRRFVNAIWEAYEPPADAIAHAVWDYEITR